MKIRLSSLALLLFSVLSVHGANQTTSVVDFSAAVTQRPSSGYADLVMVLTSLKIYKNIGDSLVSLMKWPSGDQLSPDTHLQKNKTDKESVELHTPLQNKEHFLENLEGMEKMTLDEHSLPPTETRLKRGADKKEKKMRSGKDKKSKMDKKNKKKLEKMNKKKLKKKNKEKLGKKWKQGDTADEEMMDDQTYPQNDRRNGWKKWGRNGKAGQGKSATQNDRKNGWKKLDRSGNSDDENAEDAAEDPDEDFPEEGENSDGEEYTEDLRSLQDDQEAYEDVEQNEQMIEGKPEIQTNPSILKSLKTTWKKWNRNGKMDNENLQNNPEDANRRRNAWKKWNRNGQTDKENLNDNPDASNSRRNAWKKWNRNGEDTADSNAIQIDRKQAWKKWNQNGNGDD